MATYTTYDQVGKALRRCSGINSIISPDRDCPMYTAIRPQKVHARVYEYQQDTLANAADNKAVEGAISEHGNANSDNHEDWQHANSH